MYRCVQAFAGARSSLLKVAEDRLKSSDRPPVVSSDTQNANGQEI